MLRVTRRELLDVHDRCQAVAGLRVIMIIPFITTNRRVRARWDTHSKGTPRDATFRPSMREPASSAATATAVHVVESGPDSSFQPDQPEMPASSPELEDPLPPEMPRFRVPWEETPLAPEIVALRDSEGTGFGRDDRYSGFWGSRRPGWPAWSTSSATIAALRGSERRLLGARGGVLPPCLLSASGYKSRTRLSPEST